MRLFAARNLARLARGQSHKFHGPTLRHALLLSGLGLSMLALARGEMADVHSAHMEAQCDARYAPPEVEGAFSVPLEREEFAPITKSRATRVSSASYKANFPIEDKYAVATTDAGDVFATVLDGHGGWQVSEYARKTLIGNVQKELAYLYKPGTSEPAQGDEEAVSDNRVAAAIQRAFGRTDRDLMAEVASAFKLGFGAVARCGSCACLAYVHEGTVHVANAGDIRAVLGKLGKEPNTVVAEPLSKDQNAMVKIEQEKLIKEHPGEANAFTCRHPDSCYVKGALQPTRAFGDFALKHPEFNGPPYKNGDRSAGRHFSAPYTPPYITAIPEVTSHKLSEGDKFLIIGSDGLWDYLSNEEAVEIVNGQASCGNHDLAGRALVERVLQKAAKRYGMTYQELLSLPPGSHRRRRHDDTTVVVLFFD
ncbi:protein phosphatase 2C, putative [Phytophthora infestans T30-4]|uniref:Protein phosphatase 2C, putative n=2 Tax=Phytophthora infestans TaxID=4787 RepID=D0MQY3_PHYIT|nr:protein phosphatase 2C, putative [Phytophthora infestans T30-4]EEY57902.1 protein phosphatase 2C, putative [Phytophthora infestans T30-4]KAF4033437.1 Protein phosphatase 2C [Phytophthora infestans]KAF4133815.1 Protein phosphatase 2C [Phytophthora infestans]|eukprot:XP_002909088.1 protein phosphatase 2C, putative [Phytophthora infestans T30-4]